MIGIHTTCLPVWEPLGMTKTGAGGSQVVFTIKVNKRDLERAPLALALEKVKFVRPCEGIYA